MVVMSCMSWPHISSSINPAVMASYMQHWILRVTARDAIAIMIGTVFLKSLFLFRDALERYAERPANVPRSPTQTQSGSLNSSEAIRTLAISAKPCADLGLEKYGRHADLRLCASIQGPLSSHSIGDALKEFVADSAAIRAVKSDTESIFICFEATSRRI